jgi:hypothetical protein
MGRNEHNSGFGKQQIFSSVKNPLLCHANGVVIESGGARRCTT